MDRNPFHDIAKADAHTPKDVANLFVRAASPIWRDLRQPINHIVVGARGTGKTMALRQLDYRTLASGGQSPDFIGIYTHVSRIAAIFRALFVDRKGSADTILARQFQQVFADYLALEIIRGLCELADRYDQLACPDFSAVFRLPGGFDTGDIAANCARLQILAESSIQSWQISGRCAWQPLGDLPTIVARLANGLRRANAWLDRDRPCLYLLLDESSPIPVDCQSALNSLLGRGQPYCAKLGVRSCEWRTLDTPSGRAIELNTDVLALCLDRSDDASALPIAHMEQITEKVLASRGFHVVGIRSLLPAGADYPYSGFEAVCAASSGNPQDLLLLCSAIFAAWGNEDGSDEQAFAPVPPSLQDQVVRVWSRDFGEQNSYEASRNFCQALVQRVKRETEARRSIGFEYRSDKPGLFTSGVLPSDLAEPLRPAFAGGFLRSGNGTCPSLLGAPARFQLSRGALPALGLPLATPAAPPMILDREFLETKARAGPRFGISKKIPAPVTYVSSSFIEAAGPRWGAVSRALIAAGLSYPNVRPTKNSPTWFHDVRRKIAKARVALLGGQGAKSRTMFEIGLCAGAPRPVEVILGRLESGEEPLAVTGGLPPLPTVSCHADDSSYARFAAEVGTLARQLMAVPSDFANIALTGVSLRPKRSRDKTIYLSLPEMAVQRIPLEEIRERLAACGWSLITEEDMTSYTANTLQIPVLCAYTARIGVIDTSGVDGLDAIQSYKLGLFAGKRGWRVLHTSSTESVMHSAIDLGLGVECFQWDRPADLVGRILSFIQG